MDALNPSVLRLSRFARDNSHSLHAKGGFAFLNTGRKITSDADLGPLTSLDTFHQMDLDNEITAHTDCALRIP